MTTCLVCPSWAPCKCAGGPVVPQIAVAPLTQQIARGVRAPAPAKAGPRINIRAKGANGEREVIDTLIPIVQRCMREQGFPDSQVAKASRCIQRNQNQSAVGGNDLSHTFGMSFEVKRQEALSVNTWWKQTVAAAAPNGELPVLVYRQNKQAWRVVTLGSLHLPGHDVGSFGEYKCRIETDWDTFKLWFAEWVTRKLKRGELPKGVSE